MLQLFLIARRDSSQTITSRIVAHIAERYRSINVIRDVRGSDSEDYMRRVDGAMQQSNAVLVVIGPEWSQSRAPSGQSWRDDPTDPVAVEIAAALRHHKLIVPLLVHETSMPTAAELPASLANFVFHQGVKVRSDPYFTKDIQQVYAQINTQLSWRPASVLLLAGAIGLLTLNIGELFIASVDRNLGASFLNAILVLIFFLFYLLSYLWGVLLTIQRRQFAWLAVFVIEGIISAVLFLLDLKYFFMLGIVYPFFLALFALFSKRREMI